MTVANTILQQMGGANRVEAMLGAKYMMAIDNGVGILPGLLRLTPLRS